MADQRISPGALFPPWMLAQHGQSGEPKAIQGKRTVLNTKPDGAGGFIVQATPLISARQDAPRQWAITLCQAVKQSVGNSPWHMTAEGTISNAGVNAPDLPGGTQAMQVYIRWGAGGTSFEAWFDYPAAGACFGLTADTLDLSVFFRTDPVSQPYASAGDIPVVGAFMVEGIVQDPVPLRWGEANFVAAAAGNQTFFLVKPFAKKLRVNTHSSGAYPAAGAFVKFFGTNSDFTYDWAAGQQVFDVPAGAEQVSFFTGGTTPTVNMEWLIGLA